LIVGGQEVTGMKPDLIDHSSEIVKLAGFDVRTAEVFDLHRIGTTVHELGACSRISSGGVRSQNPGVRRCRAETSGGEPLSPVSAQTQLV
jgi:hypothetical protein